MNIFFLDRDPAKAAQAHYDKHLNKMLLEAAQMLSTAFWCGASKLAEQLRCDKAIYKPTHVNHPCSIWTRTTIQNWLWLKRLAENLNYEARFRFQHSRNHKSWEMIQLLPLPEFLTNSRLHKPAMAFDSEYECIDYRIYDPMDFNIESYRNYYAFAKRHLFGYTRREVPMWLIKRRKETKRNARNNETNQNAG